MRIVRTLPYLVSVVTMVLLLAGARGNDQANVIRATRIELVDRNGNLRGYWSAEDPNCLELRIVAGKLSIKDEDGKPRMMLAVSKGGTSLGLADGDGKVPVMLGATKEGPAVGLLSEDGEPGVTMTVSKEGPELFLCDRSGNPRVSVSVHENGPSQVLYDESSKARVGLGVSKDGSGLGLFGEEGKLGVTLGVNTKDGPALLLHDKNGKDRLSLTVAMHAAGLRVCDENGKPLAGLGVSRNGLGLMALGWNNKSGTPYVALNASTDDGPSASEPQLYTVDSAGRESYVPTGALGLLFNDYVSGNLGNRMPLGGPYRNPSSTETGASSLMREYLKGFFQEMGRQAASPGR